jgi:hypothetical protein
MWEFGSALLTSIISHIEALLKAIAEKLIPGIPEETRVSILQQTDLSDANSDDLPADGFSGQGGPTVLEDVVDKATAKSELEQEIKCKCLRVFVMYKVEQ